MSRRLFEHFGELGVTETACVLGTGANGEAAWSRIPLDAWLIGVNGAIEIPLPFPLHLHARMVFDCSAPRLPWYEAYNRPSSALTIMGTSLPCECADYRFNTDMIGGAGVKLANMLRSDATVGGAALDMLRWCYDETGKPSTVYLCGLDFGGGQYFNGYRCLQQGTWGQLACMNALIGNCQHSGMRILTLSETELDVPLAG